MKIFKTLKTLKTLIPGIDGISLINNSSYNDFVDDSFVNKNCTLTNSSGDALVTVYDENTNNIFSSHRHSTPGLLFGNTYSSDGFIDIKPFKEYTINTTGSTSSDNVFIYINTDKNTTILSREEAKFPPDNDFLSFTITDPEVKYVRLGLLFDRPNQGDYFIVENFTLNNMTCCMFNLCSLNCFSCNILNFSFVSYIQSLITFETIVSSSDSSLALTTLNSNSTIIFDRDIVLPQIDNGETMNTLLNGTKYRFIYVNSNTTNPTYITANLSDTIVGTLVTPTGHINLSGNRIAFNHTSTSGGESIYDVFEICYCNDKWIISGTIAENIIVVSSTLTLAEPDINNNNVLRQNATGNNLYNRVSTMANTGTVSNISRSLNTLVNSTNNTNITYNDVRTNALNILNNIV